jgi:hypothetical protein
MEATRRLFFSIRISRHPKAFAFPGVRQTRGSVTSYFGKLRGISHQLRPDIVDFSEHTFSEIKTEAYAKKNRGKVSYQITHYYDLTEEIRRDEPPPSKCR